MNLTVTISAITAFVIGFGGSIGVAFVAVGGEMPSSATWISAALLGAVTAAKDVRSLLKLPPVNGNGTTKP